MKKISKKMIISIFTLVLVFIALGTTTFAWFTIGNQVSAGSFTAAVRDGEGIDVSLDGKEWKRNISQAFDAVTLEHLTTKDGLTMLTMAGDEITDNANGNKPYIEQKIYFRSRARQSIYLEEFGSGQAADGDSLIPLSYSTTPQTNLFGVTIPEFNLFNDQQYIFDPLNAVKVSFETHTSYAADPTTTVKGNGAATLAYAFELSDNDVTFSDGDANFILCDQFDASVTEYYRSEEGKYVYVPNVTSDNFETYTEGLYKFGGYTAVGTQRNTNWAPVSNSPESLAYRYMQVKNFAIPTVGPIFNNYSPVYDSSSSPVVQYWSDVIDDLYYTVVTMRIWLEGWDGDCLNSILNTKNITIAFKFTTSAPQQD